MSRRISLADDAYESLDNARQPGESFSDVVRRLVAEDRNERLLAKFGILKEREEEWKKIGEQIYANRRADKFRKIPKF